MVLEDEVVHTYVETTESYYHSHNVKPNNAVTNTQSH